MTRTIARRALTLGILVYCVAVLVCMVLVAGYAGYGPTDWPLVLALVIMTLPWSLISVPFSYALIHGASLWFFSLVYLGGGAANAFLVYRYGPRLLARLRRRAA